MNLNPNNSLQVLIKPVTSYSDIQTVANLAHKIWNQHYVPIIGQKQVDYMLEKFQDVEAIKHQIATGYEYFVIDHQKQPCGYLALVPNSLDKKMMISKIYVDSDFRNLKLGSLLLNFAIEEAKTRTFESIWLAVNKNNSKSIEWYQNKGFSIMENIKIDIGNGFVMDDYLMKMPLSN
jgi:ribosomal protein S18 acetylase RimI-like enzyme